jgi:integrase
MNTFFVSEYPTRPNTPWKLEIPASVAGRRVKRFFRSEAEAWAAGPQLLETIRRRGTEGLEAKVEGMTVARAAKEYLATKRSASYEHQKKIQRITDSIAKRFPGPVRAILPLMASKWFASMKGSPTTRAGWHRYASGFFVWCVDMEIADRNPLKRVAHPTPEPRRVLLQPQEMAAILEATMSDELRAWFLLGAFAGLRSVEVRRMKWQDIDAKTGEIFIGLDVSKQSSGLPQRIVDFTEPLKRRADFFKGRTGTIVPDRSLRYYRERVKLIAKLNEEKKVPWSSFPENVLRHSFATYYLADCKDPQKTAHQLGHSSAKMVREVYAVPARRSNAEAWWAI